MPAGLGTLDYIGTWMPMHERRYDETEIKVALFHTDEAHDDNVYIFFDLPLHQSVMLSSL